MEVLKINIVLLLEVSYIAQEYSICVTKNIIPSELYLSAINLFVKPNKINLLVIAYA